MGLLTYWLLLLLQLSGLLHSCAREDMLPCTHTPTRQDYCLIVIWASRLLQGGEVKAAPCVKEG